MSKEEVWCGIVSWENLAKNELILNHIPPQVYRAIALLFIIHINIIKIHSIIYQPEPNNSP